MTMIVVVPLSRHYDESGQWPCPVGQARAKRARELVEEARVKPRVKTVKLALGAGREAIRTSGPTLAECSERYLCTTRPKCEILVNHSDYQAITTLSEMRWVVNRVQLLYPEQTVEYWFVTSPRHHWRVGFICRRFFPGIRARAFPSHDRPMPWVVEGQGYAKLGVILLMGEARVERWRYRMVRPRYRK